MKNEIMMSNEIKLPIYLKYCLSIKEASLYFNIGEKKIRQLATENLDSGFVLQNGVKITIKRKKFEDFLDRTTVI